MCQGGQGGGDGGAVLCLLCLDSLQVGHAEPDDAAGLLGRVERRQLQRLLLLLLLLSKPELARWEG